MNIFDELVSAASTLGVLSRSVTRGEQIARRDHVSLVLSGSVALLAPGKDLLATIAGPGDVIGAETLAGLSSSLRGAWLTSGRVLEIPSCEVRDEEDSSNVLRWLGKASARMQIALAREIACRTEHGITARLANLLSIMSQQGHVMTVRGTQLELSRLLGVQRTSICAAMIDLKQLKIAKAIRGRIEIGDSVGLREAACGCGSHRSFDGQESFSPIGVSWTDYDRTGRHAMVDRAINNLMEH